MLDSLMGAIGGVFIAVACTLALIVLMAILIFLVAMLFHFLGEE